MEDIFNFKKMVILTLPLAVLIAIASILGILVEDIYSKEAPEYAAQGVGQDIINLFVVMPVLLVAAFLIRRGSRLWQFVWLGSMIYTVYSYTVYCFGVHFNALFLVYCAILGLSFYLLIGFLISVDAQEIKSWFDDKTPVKMTSNFLFVVAGLFYFIWLSDVVPALINGKTPEPIKEYEMLVNPVHVMDLALALPGVMISAALLRKRHALGYVLAPAFIVFIIVMSIAIGGIIAVTIYRGFEGDLSMTVVFAIIAAISSVIFIALVKHLEREKEQE
ncbi:MAG: hypothetical protein JSW00_16720 [Thermoplasmata archaeon]|nr:MAG: hypothetical protein JSW00_16720 [Thermoplasmata archaeon]